MSEDQMLEWTKKLTAIKEQIEPLFDTEEGRIVLEELATYITTNLDSIDEDF